MSYFELTIYWIYKSDGISRSSALVDLLSSPLSRPLLSLLSCLSSLPLLILMSLLFLHTPFFPARATSSELNGTTLSHSTCCLCFIRWLLSLFLCSVLFCGWGVSVLGLFVSSSLPLLPLFLSFCVHSIPLPSPLGSSKIRSALSVQKRRDLSFLSSECMRADVSSQGVVHFSIIEFLSRIWTTSLCVVFERWGRTTTTRTTGRGSSGASSTGHVEKTKRGGVWLSPNGWGVSFWKTVSICIPPILILLCASLIPFSISHRARRLAESQARRLGCCQLAVGSLLH